MKQPKHTWWALEGQPGSLINNCVEDAIEAAKQDGKAYPFVTLHFNGVDMMVKPDSDPKEVVQEFHRRLDERAKRDRRGEERRHTLERALERTRDDALAVAHRATEALRDTGAEE